MKLLLVLLSVIAMSLAEICMDKVCEFHWEVTRVSTMTYFHKPDHKAGFHSATYNVELEGKKLKIVPNSFRPEGSDDLLNTYVDPSEVVTAGGFPRKVVVINGQMPGPTIEVMEGAEVIIHISNHMKMTSLTVHFHGLYQQKTPFMDGVAYVAQCPVLPRQTFTQRFRANPPGTHWYHAHLETLRLDGLYGMFIIHSRMPSIPQYSAMVQDWWNHDGEAMDILNPFDGDHGGTGEIHLQVPHRDYSADGVQTGALNYDLFTTIINGRGRGRNGETFPLEVFTIKQNGRVRIRTVNAGMEYQYYVSVDDHKLQVVATDGYEMEPITVTDFLIAPGETTDFELEGTQAVGNYWMRVRTIRAGKDFDVKKDNIIREGLSVIRYEGAPDEDPTSTRRTCTQQAPCVIWNCPFAGFADAEYTTCKGLNDARSTMSKAQLDEEYGVGDKEFDEHFFNFNFAYGSSINSKKFVASKVPLYQPFEESIVPCDMDCTQGCLCTHMVDLPFNRTVQMVFSSLQTGFEQFAHHPIHVHGHGFAVVKIGYPSYDAATGLWDEVNDDVICDDTYCNPAYWNGARPTDLNLVNPPVKDTILIPARGYVVIRFRTNNPGFWFVHCHTEQHVMDGMAMVFREANELIPEPPKNFPKCGDFSLTDKEYEVYDTVKYGSKANLPNTEEEETKSEDVNNPQAEEVINPKLVEEIKPQREPQSEGLFTATIPVVIGTSFALILVGALIAVLPMFCYICCVKSKKEKASEKSNGHVNEAF